jgi:hypothetical protein
VNSVVFQLSLDLNIFASRESNRCQDVKFQNTRKLPEYQKTTEPIGNQSTFGISGRNPANTFFLDFITCGNGIPERRFRASAVTVQR